MSPSPSDAASVVPDYVAGWRALNRNLRAGESWSGREPDSLFLHPGGEGRFLDAATALGFDSAGDGRALVPLDWDGDGDLDLAVTARTGPRFRLLRNDIQAAPRAVELEFDRLGAATVGTRIELTTSTGRRIVRVLRAGDGYLSHDAARVFLGLGKDDVSAVRIAWPGKEAVALEGIAGPGRFALDTGGTRALRLESKRGEALAIGGLEATADQAPVQLAAPVVMPRLTMRSTTGANGELFGVKPGNIGTGAGRPVLLLLWASWCQPCLEELAELSRDQDLFDGGTLVVALSLDEPEQEGEAFRLLEALNWPGRGAIATGETPRILEALFGALGDRRDAFGPPAALLVDESGRAVSWMRGAWSGSTKTPNLDPHTRRGAAALESGIWFRSSKDLPESSFAGRLTELGADNAAREMTFARVEIGAFDADRFVERGLALGQAGDLDGAIGAFERALLLDSEDIAAQRNLAVALDRAGRAVEARTAYRRAVSLDPEDENSWLQLARLGHEAQDGGWEVAVTALRLLGSVSTLDLKRWARANLSDD